MERENEFLDGLLEEMEMAHDEELDALITHRVNRLLLTISIKVFIIGVAIIAMIVFLLNPVMNAFNPNPYQMNQDIQYDEEGNCIGDSTLFQMLDAWIESQYPYCGLDYVNVEKKGFGRYTINVHVYDLKKPITNAQVNLQYDMTQGNLKEVMNTVDYVSRYSFARNTTENTMTEDKETIGQFPASSWLCIAITEKELEEVTNLTHYENNDLRIDWVEVYDGNETGLGLNLKHIRKDASNMDTIPLKQQYINKLSLLASLENDWMTALGISMPQDQGMLVIFPMEARRHINEVKETIEKVDTLQTKYYYISGTKESILEFLEEKDLRSAKIVNAALWRGY